MGREASWSGGRRCEGGKHGEGEAEAGYIFVSLDSEEKLEK
jgi:hypothetical protein